ncbi:hypothetical protein NDU88_000438 [Pleurodeles waltl]|uniref:Uncharacterized protein n=1 Tax=Pleurodeles waltl TaxID=8319 RepID=A0AAV7VUQ0_PLEWA|nr:hypothetical protein NDU88_000438 [Pleurodeles waltl]
MGGDFSQERLGRCSIISGEGRDRPVKTAPSQRKEVRAWEHTNEDFIRVTGSETLGSIRAVNSLEKCGDSRSQQRTSEVKKKFTVPPEKTSAVDKSRKADTKGDTRGA